MKKLSKVLVISLLALVMIIALAACGSGAPSYVKNPPETSEELITKLEDDDWFVIEAGEEEEFGGFAVLAMKIPDISATAKPTDKITVEIVIVVFYETEEVAIAAKTEKENYIKEGMEEEIPEGVSFSISITQKGKTISAYAKITLTISEFFGA